MFEVSHISMRHNLSSIFQLKKGSNLRTLFTSQSPKMSSMAFSTTFFTSLHDFTHARTNPPNSPSFPFIKSSLASSNSTFFHPTLSLQTLSTFPRFIKPRSFSVHARAATEKTIYDFTVKVPCLISISTTLSLENNWVNLGI